MKRSRTLEARLLSTRTVDSPHRVPAPAPATATSPATARRRFQPIDYSAYELPNSGRTP